MILYLFPNVLKTHQFTNLTWPKFRVWCSDIWIWCHHRICCLFSSQECIYCLIWGPHNLILVRNARYYIWRFVLVLFRFVARFHAHEHIPTYYDAHVGYLNSCTGYSPKTELLLYYYYYYYSCTAAIFPQKSTMVLAGYMMPIWCIYTTTTTTFLSVALSLDISYYS